MKVTVVIPTYRRVHYLEQAIESVLAQTYGNFEVIVVNDCRDDHEAVTSLVERMSDSRIRLHSDGRQRGGNGARNLGIRLGDGPLVAFLDDDDIWRPTKLERHVEHHQSHPRVGAIYSGFVRRWEEPVFHEDVHFADRPGSDMHTLIGTGFCPVSTSLVTVRRECFQTVGDFDESLISYQDWDMWYRISARFALAAIDEPLAVIREHAGLRTSKNLEKRTAGLQQIARKWQSSPNAPLLLRRLNQRLVLQGTYEFALHRQRLAAASYFATGLMRFPGLLLHKGAFRRLLNITTLTILGPEPYFALKRRRRSADQRMRSGPSHAGQ